MLFMAYAKERDQYDYPFHVKLRRFFTGIPDWLLYVVDEVRNAEKHKAGFRKGELQKIEVRDNLKAPKKAGSYASRIRRMGK